MLLPVPLLMQGSDVGPRHLITVEESMGFIVGTGELAR